MQKNLKTIGTYTESIDSIFKAFKKIIHFYDTVPLSSLTSALPPSTGATVS
jgi:hypothetical protein